MRWIPVWAGLALVVASGPLRSAEDVSMLLVTTTSVRDSGLLDSLLPIFREQTGVRVQVVAVGSGAALRMGAEGNADVLLTHAPDGEKALVASGALADRRPFMENYFVIAGPSDDPVDVRGAATPVEAFQRIAAASAPFVSRGDDSGTHRRERALFGAAGLDPDAGWTGLDKTGSGMGLTLQVAGERRAYVLSDLGTFLAFRDRVNLEALSRTSLTLRNVYSVLRVDPEKVDSTRARAAEQFEAFLLAPETQGRIREFGRERFGRSLFLPLHPVADAAGP